MISNIFNMHHTKTENSLDFIRSVRKQKNCSKSRFLRKFFIVFARAIGSTIQYRILIEKNQVAPVLSLIPQL